VGYSEQALLFECETEKLIGVLSTPAVGIAPASIAALIVVGGPQYRVGSHRQFVLLARRLAAAGFPTLRFDYRGMGDSDGAPRSFEHAEADIRSAIDILLSTCPSIRTLVIWGLCDAASAALMYCSDDQRVSGLVLLNPWARSDASLAAAHIKHYYRARLLDADLWRKLVSGRFDWRASIRSLADGLSAVMRRRTIPAREPTASAPFQTRMAAGWHRFGGQILLILSGRDLTAKEFVEYARSSGAWRDWLGKPNVTRLELESADHTFSDLSEQRQVEDLTLAFLSRIATGA